MTKNPKQEVQDAISELRALLQIYEPIELLARVTTYIVPGDPDKPKDEGGPAKSETNLDYLMSMVTAQPYPEQAQFPHPDAIQRAIELVTTIHTTATVHLLTKRKEGTEAEEALADFADAFRLDKLHVRGDAYWPHLKQTVTGLLQPHDAKLREILGFDSADYLGFMERTETEMQRRFEEMHQTEVLPYFERINPFVKKGDTGKMELTDPAALERYWQEHQVEMEALHARFDRFGGPGLYTFTPHTAAEGRILEMLSCACGENVDFLGTKPEHAFWPLNSSLSDHRPILRHGGKHYAFNLLKLQRETYTLMGDLVREKDPKYWQDSFIPARDRYLEREVAALLQQALPPARILLAAKYPLASGDEAEVDILVLCDDVLLVVECKAGRLNAATKRGADKKILSDMKATVAGGLNQAERFVTELVTRGQMMINTGGSAETLAASAYRHILRINVTLDLINPVATELWKLKTAGLTGKIEHCWSVSLNDLRVIIDILDQSAVFVHYLLRRLDLNIIGKVRARDELDYLMHYVRQGLFFRESNTPPENGQVMLHGFTEELDQYYRKVQGFTDRGDKPRVDLGAGTQWVIDALQAGRPQHWLTGCLELMDFDRPIREDLVARLPTHRRVLADPAAAYGISIIANGASRQGVILASSLYPAKVGDVITARAVQLCREHGLIEIVVILGSFPVWETKLFVIPVTTTVAVKERAAQLLARLSIEQIEFRRS